MNDVRPANPRFAQLVPYDPKYLPAQVMISANENPLTVPGQVLDGLMKRLRALPFNRYPDPLANDLRDAIARAEGVRRENVLVGNGGDELLFDLALAWGGVGRTMLNVPPTFSVYAYNAYLTGTNVVDIPRKSDYTLDEGAILKRVGEGDVDFAIVTSPNNPTGDIAGRSFVERLLDAGDALILVDEAYCEFSGQTLVDLVSRHRNLAILRTFSKAYALAGVRIGYLIADASVIEELQKVRQPYSVDAISQAVALEVMNHRDLFRERIDDIVSQRAIVFGELRSIDGVCPYPSQANFILVRFDDGTCASWIWRELLDRGVLVRDFSRSPGLGNCLRISIGTSDENDKTIDALRDILKG